MCSFRCVINHVNVSISLVSYIILLCMLISMELNAQCVPSFLYNVEI